MNRSKQLVSKIGAKILYPNPFNKKLHFESPYNKPVLPNHNTDKKYPYKSFNCFTHTNKPIDNDNLTVYLITGLIMSSLIANCITCLDDEIDPNDYTCVILSSVV